MSDSLVLRAPLAGWAMALAAVPDKVFADGMAGDGVAIDPTAGVLHAPCDGEIVAMGDARHAVTVRAHGVDVLAHVGIDTVTLGGAGFELLVRAGERVRAGEELLRFDLDHVARRAKSAASPIVVASGGTVARRAIDTRVAVGDFLMEVTVASAGVAAARGAPAMARRRYRVAFEHGLHVRPAALVAAALRPFAAMVTLIANGREADARSPVAMMSLGVHAGDAVEIAAAGADAEAALDALAPFFAPERASAAVAVPAPPHEPARRAQGERRALLEAHAQLLDDPQIAARARDGVRRNRSAAFAWREATRSVAAMLQSLGDERMRERAADLRDLEAQVLRVLAGKAPVDERELPADAIVIAEELLPSQLMALDVRRLAGICMARGGPTSHVALVAAATGIPLLDAAGPRVLEVRDAAPVILDAEHGWLDVEPAADELERSRAERARRAARDIADREAALAPSQTRDGVRIVVNANAGGLDEARLAVSHGADGIGLLRTEFLFVDRREAPDEDEQLARYREIAAALAGRTLTVRTLDTAGDKPLAYLPLPREDNPALGLRGVRATFLAPELMRAQIRAVLRVDPPGQCRLLLPMVNDAGELRELRALAEACARELGRSVPALGVMIETPAAALQAPALARDADFLSIGSNDLAQYTLAIDRGHPQLASRLDALHPAMLRLMATTAEAARALGKSVSVCGALACDIEALPILIGLGIHELSATPATVPKVKRAARWLDAAECRAAAVRALDAPDAAAVREIARVLLAEAGAALTTEDPR